MNHSDDELRQAVGLFRYGLIADLAHLPPGTPGIGERLREKANHAYTIPGTRRTRVAAETIRDWLALYRSGGFEALYPKARVDRGRPRRLPPDIAELLVGLKTEQPSLSVNALIAVARERGVERPLAPSCTACATSPSRRRALAALCRRRCAPIAGRPALAHARSTTPLTQLADSAP